VEEKGCAGEWVALTPLITPVTTLISLSDIRNTCTLAFPTQSPRFDYFHSGQVNNSPRLKTRLSRHTKQRATYIQTNLLMKRTDRASVINK